MSAVSGTEETMSVNGYRDRVFFRKQCPDIWCSQCLWVKSPRGPRPHIDDMGVRHWAQSRLLVIPMGVHQAFRYGARRYIESLQQEKVPYDPDQPHCFRVLGSDRIAYAGDTMLTLGLWYDATILMERVLIPSGPWTQPPPRSRKTTRVPRPLPPPRTTLRMCCSDKILVTVSHAERLAVHSDFVAAALRWGVHDHNNILEMEEYTSCTMQRLVNWLLYGNQRSLPSGISTTLDLIRAADQFLVHGHRRYGIIQRMGRCIHTDKQADYVRDVALGLGTWPELVHLCDLFLEDVDLPPVFPNAYYSGKDLAGKHLVHDPHDRLFIPFSYYPADMDRPRKRPRLV